MTALNPPLYATIDELYSRVCSGGILVDEGNVWFAMDDNGKYQEMISAMKFMHLDPKKYEMIALRESSPTCRFPMVVKIFNASKLNMQVKITTQFLSSGVTYAAYLRCKHKYSPDYPIIRSLKYRLNNQSQSYKSYCGDYKDGWMMLELFQTTSIKHDVEFNVSLQGFCLANFLGDDEVIVEGIVFLPIQKFEDEIKDQNMENPLTSEIEWSRHLPSDYEHFVYLGKNIVKKLQDLFIAETKEEAFSMLTKGVHIKIEGDMDVWFWITKSNGKKCFMLSPESIQASNQDKLKVRHKNESRFRYVLQMKSNLYGIHMSFKIRSPLFSSKTTYACYLVYKIHVHLQNPLRVTIKQRMLKLPRGDNDFRNNHRRYNQEKFVYLSLPQSPIIEPDGALRSCGTINKPEMIEFPRKREDGWWEVRLGEFVTHDNEQMVQCSRPRNSTSVPAFPHANADEITIKFAKIAQALNMLDSDDKDMEKMPMKD
ncbi:hypothetical protein Lser_V15G12891 [Lactuca serriola]